MSTLRKIAEIPAGSWTKWVVVGFWVVLLIILFPLQSKLTGAEKNDAKQWLPANAESTKVVDLQSRFVPPNIESAVVVYERASGLSSRLVPPRTSTSTSPVSADFQGQRSRHALAAQRREI